MIAKHPSSNDGQFPTASLKSCGSRPIGVSLFTGAMGLDLGIERAAGVRYAVAAESDPAARATIAANRPGLPIFKDVSRLHANDVRQMAGLGPSDGILVVSGSPPCQGVSVAGKKLGVRDARTGLVFTFTDLAVELNPEFIVMEQVPGLATTELGGQDDGVIRLVSGVMRSRGYDVAWGITCAANFGAFTKRKRLILIASRVGPAPQLVPTHSEFGENGLPRWRTLGDAVEGLPDWPCDYRDYSDSIGRFMVNLEAGQWWKHLPEHLKVQAVSAGQYRGGGGTATLRRLSWDRPCPTVTCNPGQRMTTLGHPDEDRPLSVQECRRVQGLPDDWVLKGNTRAKHRQLGNMVPVQLGEAVGRAIASAERRPLRDDERRADRPVVIDMPTKPKRLSSTISKKGKDILAWSVRAAGGKCAFASKLCSKLCYALRGRFRYHRAKYQENHEFTKSPGFVDAMVEELRVESARREPDPVSCCVHEMGDFRSLEYLRKWRSVMECTADCTNMAFYVYTRSWTNPEFLAELRDMGSALRNVRINLSVDRELAAERGVPTRVGDGLVTWLAENDQDLPPEGSGIDLVFRNTAQKDLPPAEFLGGLRVCPNEAHLFSSTHDGKPVLKKGKPVRIECQDCRLCIDRSPEEWDSVKHGFLVPGAARVVTFLDLFSGVGAGRKGFEDACRKRGLVPKCVGFCETDARAAETYLRHYPGTRSLGDVEELAKSGDVPKCDFVIGGFPCQGNSRAGKRKGLDDPRSMLVFDMIKIAQLAKAKAVLGENVDRLATQNGGKDLGRILDAFRGAGFSTIKHAVMNSRDWVPQNRPRLYVAAFRGEAEFEFPEPAGRTMRLRDILEDQPVDPVRYISEGYLAGLRRHRARHAAGGSGFGYKVVDPDGVASALACGGDGPQHNLVVDERIGEFPVLPGRKTPISRECVRSLTPEEWESLQGLPRGWTAGQADTRRYRQLGNAMTVPVIEAVSERMLSAVAAPAADAKPRALALFAGCGGMTRGFEDAGWDVVAANESDEDAAATHRLNFPAARMIEGDITDPAVKSAVIEAARGCRLVFGGPPCTGNSTSGKRDPEDPAGSLYKDFLDVVEGAFPAAVAIENVQGITSMRCPEGIVSEVIIERLRSLGYAVEARILCAADWGVPQVRKRWILVAVRPGVAFDWPEPTHAEGGAGGLPGWVTAEEALRDLEDVPENRVWSHVFAKNCPEVLERIRRAKCGESANGRIESHRRLWPDRPATTVKAHYAGLHVHYRLDRLLSPREEARLQGFDDRFRFMGCKTSAIEQVGNAVPPVLARSVAGSVLDSVAPKAQEPAADNLRVISLFTGCGGMDLGFEGGFDVPAGCVNSEMRLGWVESDHGNGWVRLRPTGFRTVFACDIEDSAKQIWVRNFSKRGHSPEEFHLGSVVDLVKSHRNGGFKFPEAEVVAFGFPCPDFSHAGKRRGFRSEKDHMGKPMTPDTPEDESRGMLYLWGKEAVSIVKPRVFVAENVDGLNSVPGAAEKIRTDFDELGYDVSVQTLYGPDLGVPQTRKRVIFIGASRDAVSGEIPALHPHPTHGDGLAPTVTTDVALRGLPEPSESDDPSHQAVSKAKYLPPTEDHPAPFQGQKEVPLDRPGPTIRADHHGHIEFRRLSKEHGGFHAEELAAGLPERRLTVRECARIQTFPDEFEFIFEDGRNGQPNQKAGYLAVGNAVPPLLAYAVAMHLREIWPALFGNGAVGEARPVIEFPCRREGLVRPVRVAELFAGIGGMGLAARQACDCETVFASEMDEHAATTYEANHGMIPAGDITRIDARDVPQHDILFSGFPCTSFSIAGRRLGYADPSTGDLFGHTIRIAMGCGPAVVICENVRNFVSHDGGRTLEIALNSFKRIGYIPRWRVLNASGWCPTARKRVFIVAFRDPEAAEAFRFPRPPGIPSSFRDCLLPLDDVRQYVLSEGRIFVPDGNVVIPDASGAYPQTTVRVGLIGGRNSQGYRVYDANAHAITFSASGGGLAGQCGWYLIDGVVRKAAPRECARAMGLPDSFVLPQDDKQAWRQIGNSVAVPVVREVVRAAVDAAGLAGSEASEEASSAA